VALLWAFTGLASVWAQDSSDSLFTNPEPDSKADTTQKVTIDPFNGRSVNFFETLSVDGYLISGFRSDGELVNTPVPALNFGFGTDIRLDKTARAYASFYLSYPGQNTSNTDLYNPYQPTINLNSSSSAAFSSIQVKELFLDYSLGDLAIFRLGRQTATWGQGKIFNPGNLVEGIENGAAAKLSMALGPVSLTAVAIKNDGEYNITSTTQNAASVESLGEAMLAEYSAQVFSLGLSGFYNANVGGKLDGYIKTSLWGADVFVETLAEHGTHAEQTVTGVAGLYREFGGDTKWLKLQTEWLVSGRGSTGSFATVSTQNLGFSDQSLGVAASTDLLSFASLKPSVAWLQSLADGSGQVIVGVVSSALPHIDLSMALTRVYGASGTRYIVNNPDTEDRVWSLTLKASFSFDIKSVDTKS